MCRIKSRRIGALVKKAPTDSHDQRNHQAKENPAVKYMVKTRGKFDVAMLRDIDCGKGTDTIGNNGHNNAYNHEGNSSWPAREAQVRNQRPKCHHRDEKLDPRARLSHFEIAARCGDENAINMRRNARPSEQRHAHFRGDRLQHWHGFFAKWHEEEHVE